MADPNMVNRGEGVRWRLINATFTVDFIIFCHQIQDKCDKIMFSISMNNTRLNNINFIFITFKKAKLMHAKVTNWTHTLVTIYPETALQ